MKQILLIFFLIIFTKTASGQIEADSIFIYQNFKRAGTTAGLNYHYRVLDSTQAKKVKLTEQEVNVIIQLFRKTKKKRFFQQKHGGEICYMLIWNGGIRYRYVLEGNNNWIRLVNLHTMRKWTLEEPEKVKRFQEIINKNWP